MIRAALCILLMMVVFATAIGARQDFWNPGQNLQSRQEPETSEQHSLPDQSSGFSAEASPAQQEPEYLVPVEFDYRYKAEVYAIIIDACVAREYRRERISGALGIEGMDKLKLFADSMDTETPLYIYCDGESRSRTVAQYLGDQGFTRLYILSGGIREWKAADMPLDKKRLRRRR